MRIRDDVMQKCPSKSMRYISALFSLILFFTALPYDVCAASADVVPASISIRYNNRTISTENVRIVVAAGEEITLDYRISPTNANTSTDISWRSSDTSVADVDESGSVYANKPGESRIRVRTENGRSASCVVYVPEKGGVTGRIETVETITGSTDTLTSMTTEDAVKFNGEIPREILLNVVRLGNSGIPATLSGYESVSSASLQAAAGIGNFAIRFDTMLGKVVVGRITLAPGIAENTSNSIQLGVYSKTENTQKVQGIFDKFFKNATVVILCEQERFPGPVEIAARVGTMNGNKLHFYSYNPQKNTRTNLDITNAMKDKNNYVHFTTSAGGYIVVSDGPLTSKS